MPFNLQCLEALNSEFLDTSDFILISIHLLKTNNLITDQQLLEIQTLYFHYDYDNCLEKIKKITEGITSENDTAKKIQDSILKNRVLTSSNPMENISRRYFETEFSEHIFNNPNPDCFSAIEKIREFYKQHNYEITFNDPVCNHEDIAKILNSLRGFCYQTTIILNTELKIRAETNSLSSDKDRGPPKSEPSVSKNPGIATAHQPMYSFNLLSEPRTNLSTTYTMDSTEHGFSHTHHHIPFVNSLSGTSYSVAAMLFHYIEANKNNPSLNKDVNFVIKYFLIFMAKSGFHSLGEMINVFESEQIKELLKPVTLLIDYNLQDFSSSFENAAMYSALINQHRTLHHEIKSKSSQDLSTSKSITTSDTDLSASLMINAALDVSTHYLSQTARQPDSQHNRLITPFPSFLISLGLRKDDTGPEIYRRFQKKIETNPLSTDDIIKYMSIIEDLRLYKSSHGKQIQLKELNELYTTLNIQLKEKLTDPNESKKNLL